MNFGTQFRQMRTDRHLTQDQVASQLHVSRQAVSNWENDRNLPDLELILQISELFDVSLDTLLKGDKTMNNLTEKLIEDTDTQKTQKLRLMTTVIGAVLMAMGLGLLVIKGLSVEYIDAQGILHENFFLIPAAWAFLLAGLIVILSGVFKKRHRP